MNLQISIKNPSEIPESFIEVDENFKFKDECSFNKEKVTWLFYGQPYYNKINKGGYITQLYGFEYCFGYLVNVFNSEIMFDVIYGLLIKRLNLDDSKWSYSDEDDKKYQNYNKTYYKHEYKFCQAEIDDIIINNMKLKKNKKYKKNRKRPLDFGY